MKQRVAPTIRIMSLVMCSLFSVTPAIAAENTNAPWNSSGNKTAVSVERIQEEAVILRKLGRFGEAMGILEKELALDPADPDLLELATTTAMDLQQWEKARGYAEKLAAASTSGQRRVNSLLLGEMYYQLGDWNQAVANLTRAGNENSADYYPQFLLGNAYANLDQQALAQTSYEKALLLLRQIPSPRIQQSLDEVLLLNKLGKAKEAFETLQKLLVQYPSEPQILESLADYYRNAQQLREARVYLEQLLAQDPKNVGILSALANIYFELGEYHLAENRVTRLHELSPGDTGSHYLLGNICAAQGRDRQARKQYRMALELLRARGVRSLSDRLTQMDIFWRLGQRRKALRELENLLKAFPEDPAVLTSAFYLYLDNNSVERARQMWQRLTTREADATRRQEMQAALLVKEHRWAQAEEVYQALLAKNTTLFLQRNYADVLFQQRKWTAAQSAYDAAWQKGHNADDLRLWRRAIEEGDPQATLSWTYFKRPQAQRDYIVGEEVAFWVNRSLRLRVAAYEEEYRKESLAGVEKIDELVISNLLEAKYYVSDELNVLARWNLSQNSGQDYNGGNLEAEWERDTWRSLFGFEGHHFVRDPIDAIQKQATWDRVFSVNRWQATDRFSLGAGLENYWYAVDENANPINGESDLGYKWIYEPFVEYRLSTKPLVTLGYHFKRGHWQKDFSEADQVIGYLSEEMAHFGVFYTELPLSKWGDLIYSVSTGYDVKRDTPFTVFYLEPKIWLNRHAQLRGSYEYDYGDSGVNGTGDSQIFKLFLTFYF